MLKMLILKESSFKKKFKVKIFYFKKKTINLF